MTGHNNTPSNIFNKLFYVAYGIMTLNICFAFSGIASFWGPFSIYLTSFFAVSSVLKIIFTKYTGREILCSIALMALMATCSYVNGDMRTLWFGLTLIAVKDLNKKQLIKITTCAMSVCLVTCVLLSLFGVVNACAEYYEKGMRCSLGMGHPNIIFAFYNIICISLMYLHSEHITANKLVFTTFLAFCLFAASKSITGLLSYLFTLIIYIILFKKKDKKPGRELSIISKLLFLIILLFSALPLVYNDSLLPLNQAMSNRISQANYYYNNYGIKAFGNDLSEELNFEWTQNKLDIGYSRMYLYNGIIYYLLVISGYLFLIRKANKEYNSLFITMISFFIIYTCSENVSTYIFMNPVMLYMSEVFIENSKELPNVK